MTTQELRELDAWLRKRFPDLAFGEHPTKSRMDSMQVLEKCAEKTFPTVYKSRANGDWCMDNQTITGDKKTRIICTAKTLPLAICLFAKQLFSK